MYKNLLKYTFLFLLVSLFSCSNSKNKLVGETSIVQENLAIVAPPKVHFTDIIPEHLSDSAKIEIIKVITEGIDSDTTVIRQTIVDSNMTLGAYYRNDTLVKLVEGSSLSHGSAYYFLMKHLICVKESCSSHEVSAMCDPFHATMTSFFYNKKLIHQDFYSSRNVGFFCGCNFGTLLSQHSGSSDESQEVLMLHINQLLDKMDNGCIN